MAQPHIILWWCVIGSSWGGAKEQIIVSLIITSFVSACLAPSKPPSSGEAMSSLCNCCMEHSSKSFGTLRFTPYSASVISKLSWAIVDSCTFEFFVIQSTNFCLNVLLTFFSDNAWFDIPFHLCILDLINQISKFCRSFFPPTICTWHATFNWILNCVNFVLICFLWLRWHNGHNILYEKIFSVFCLFSFIVDWCCMGQYFSLFHVG